MPTLDEVKDRLAEEGVAAHTKRGKTGLLLVRKSTKGARVYRLIYFMGTDSLVLQENKKMKNGTPPRQWYVVSKLLNSTEDVVECVKQRVYGGTFT